MCRYLYFNRISVSSVPLRYAHLEALSRSLIAEMWGSGPSLEFLIDCTEKQVNPRRKRCAAAVTLFVPYYFYPMKFPALKICENRDGPRREVSIEAWQRLYWQEESVKFAAVARRSRSTCVRHFAANYMRRQVTFRPFAFCEIYTNLRNEAWPRYRDEDDDRLGFHLNTLAWNLHAIEFLFLLLPYYEM